MKQIRLVILLIGLCIIGCGPDIDGPRNVYKFQNNSSEKVHVSYHVYHEVTKKLYNTNEVVSITIAANKTEQLVDIGGGRKLYPSAIFKQMVILNISNDTLQVIDTIDDTLWEYSYESEYGYKEKDHHWLYKYSKE